MWIRVALDKDSIVVEGNSGYIHVEGPHVEEYWFDENIAQLLENDGFLAEMWEKLGALLDWGDCDVFFPDKCQKLEKWLVERLQRSMNQRLSEVYKVMLDYARKAIKYDTILDFDF